MTALAGYLRDLYLALVTLFGVAWILDAPLHLGVGIITEQFVLVLCGLVTAAAFVNKPYSRAAGALEIGLGGLAFAAWCWSAWHYADWLIDIGNRGPHKWLPALVALVLLLEAVRTNCGTGIAVVMAAIGAYAFIGHLAPGVLETDYLSPSRILLYYYADANGVPGVIMATAATVVLGFIVFSKCLEVTGAGRFFDNFSLALLGSYRGGPAKVAVISSALFGLVSGSSVANVASSGAVTIPMMKRAGFSPSMAGAIEATSSNAGQITPPVMGATAFLIAEFLQISYGDVVAAAAIPAAIFYLVLYLQVDAYAVRNGLGGLPRAELPRLQDTLAEGWVFAAAVAVLVYVMFWTGTNVAKAALYAAATMIVLGTVQQRGLALGRTAAALTIGVGRDMLPILLVCAGAGIVVGSLNVTGLGFTVTVLLGQAAAKWGVLAMLSLTAVIALVLGMGMPTAAVYVLLSVVLAPALVKAGIEPLAAHMFIFYFGMMSFLTPPVALASYTAAAMAGADLWRTSLDALRIGLSGYLLPFVYALNPALLLSGSWQAVLYAIATVALSGAWISWGFEGAIGARLVARQLRMLLLLGSVVLGTATIWLGPESPFNLAALAAGAVVSVVCYALSRPLPSLPLPRSAH